MHAPIRSLGVLLAACALCLVASVTAALIRYFVVRSRRAADSAPPGHFDWVQGEMAQIAAERNTLPRRGEVRLDAALFRAELEFEARRIIADLSDGRRSVNIDEAVARGVGVTASYGILRQLVTSLDQAEPQERPAPQGSRFIQLRRLMEADDRSAYAARWRGSASRRA
jgi:hypothetical protein